MNLLIASGNIGRDVDLRFLPSDTAVANFSIPVSSGYGDKKKTTWVKCVMFGKRAESLSPYLLKGTKVTVCGEFSLDTWETDGETKSMPCIKVNEIDLHSRPEPQEPTAHPKKAAPQPESFDDDIPF